MCVGLTEGYQQNVSAATTYTSGYYTYTLNKDEATITGYSGLENPLVLPSQIDGYKVTGLGYNILGNNKSVTKVTIPNTITTVKQTSYNGAFAESAIKEAILESGATTVPNYIFGHCETLEKVTIPESVTKIGYAAFDTCISLKGIQVPSNVEEIDSYAFANCNILTLKIPNKVEKIEENAFVNCPNLIVYCNYFSRTVVGCVDQDIVFSPSDEKWVDDENKMIDRKKSIFFANTDNLSSSGALPFSIKYSIKNKWKGELSSKKIVAFIPKYTDLIEESIKIDGKLVNNYSYDEKNRRLTIPVTSESGEITYSVSIRSKEKIKSYAYLQAYKNGATTQETIGTLNEEFSGITILASDSVKSKEVLVSGISTPSTSVDLYVDGKKQGTVKTIKNGSYSGKINIENPINNMSYKIEARGIDEFDNEITASKYVVYKESSPELKSLKVEWNEHNIMKNTELVNENTVKPTIAFLPNTEFVFKAKFDDAEDIEDVYVTSTRNNEKRVLEANCDPSTDSYVTSGFFDPDNTSYVPG